MARTHTNKYMDLTFLRIVYPLTGSILDHLMYKAVQVDIQIIPCIGPIVHVYGPVQCELDRCQSADLSHSVTVESHISQRYATAVSG